MASLGKAFIEIHADLSEFPAETKTKLRAALEGAAKEMDLKPVENKIGDAGKAGADKLEKSFTAKLRDKAGEFANRGSEVGDKIMSGLLGIVTSKAMIMTMLIGAAVAGAGQLIGPVLALAAAIPAAMGIAVVAVGTLTAAFKGVGGAIAAAFGDDQQKLNEAMKKLAPAAREVVAEFASFRPQLHAMQQDIQQTFFVQLEGSVKRLMTNLLPTLRSGLHLVSADLGQMARGVTNALGTAGAKSDLAAILAGAHKALQPLMPMLGQLVTAFLTLAKAAMPFVGQLTAGLGGLVKQFADFIAKVSADGSLADFFGAALTTLQLLKAPLNAVFTILGALMDAVKGSGVNVLDILGQISTVIADLFKGPQGQQLLTAITALVGAFGQVLIAIAPILPPLALLLAQLGVDLANAITASIPLIERLVKWLSDLLTWMTDHKSTVEGFAITLGSLYAAFKIATAVDSAVTSLKEFTTTLKGLAVVEAIVGWIKGFTTATAAATVASDVMTASLVAQDAAWFANPIGLVILAIAAIIALIVLLVMNWDSVKKAGVAAWHWIEGAAKSTWNWIKGAASAIGDWFGGIIKWFEDLPGKIGGFLSGLAKTIGDKLSAAGKAVVDWFEKLPDRIGNFLSSLPAKIGGFLLDALRGAGEIVGFGIGMIIGLFIKMPFWIWEALQWLGKTIGDAFTAAWDWATHAVSVGIDAVIDFFTKLPGRAMRALDTIGKVISDAFTAAWDWATHAVSVGIDATLDFFSKLPGRIMGFIRAIPGMLRDSFVTAWNWVSDVVSKGADKVVDFARKLPGRLGGFFDNVGHTILGGLKAGINAVIGGFNSGIDKAGSFLHMSMPHIPMLAKGAIVDSPTLAVIGEKGREVVMPLNDPARAQQLAAQSGLLGILKQTSPAPVVNVTAYLGTGQLLDIVHQVVEIVINGQAQQLSNGVRAA